MLAELSLYSTYADPAQQLRQLWDLLYVDDLLVDDLDYLDCDLGIRNLVYSEYSEYSASTDDRNTGSIGSTGVADGRKTASTVNISSPKPPV